MNEQLSAISSAPVTQAPLTAPITGVSMLRSASPGLVVGTDPAPEPDSRSGTEPDSRSGTEPASATSLKSTPALNTGSTAVSTTTSTVSSVSASARSAHRSSRIARVSAFFTSGRSMVTVRIPSRSSTRRWPLTVTFRARSGRCPR